LLTWMKFAADSSFLLRLYIRGDETDAIERFLADDSKVVSVSDLARVEVVNVLLRAEGRERHFLADLGAGTKVRCESVDWSDTFQQAVRLARRFSRKLRPGGHDLILVAAAVVMGATWFLSFDRNSRQRPLAAAAGLKVWPPLAKDEKGLARQAQR
jgi:predicted nucleic acid-binding protein